MFCAHLFRFVAISQKIFLHKIDVSIVFLEIGSLNFLSEISLDKFIVLLDLLII